MSEEEKLKQQQSPLQNQHLQKTKTLDMISSRPSASPAPTANTTTHVSFSKSIPLLSVLTNRKNSGDPK